MKLQKFNIEIYTFTCRIALLSFSIFCVFGTIILVVYMYQHRKLKVFKVASPIFLSITLLGCAIMYLEVRTIYHFTSSSAYDYFIHTCKSVQCNKYFTIYVNYIFTYFCVFRWPRYSRFWTCILVSRPNGQDILVFVFLIPHC